ncbi:unnamed protein product [Rhizophagus irregularis]|uniref:Uncharacterized protein n=1 Tax=Rhizophagus irregularis TaxID=588596 RepID=A0A915ZMP5_9GLOM|nr:unnamed protein product [Rhizophagus irregularis]
MSSEKIETQNNDTTSIEILDDKDDDIRELKGNMQELEDEIENHEKSIYRILKEIPKKEKDDLWNEIEYHKKSIYRIFVPQYMNDTSSNDDYVVTYSYDHDSFLGWPINIDEKNKLNELQPDVYVKLVPLNNLLPYLDDFVLLSKKIMSLYLYRKHWLIDFNNDRTGDTGFLELENTVNCVDSDNGHDGRDTIGFLPNGDLIQVSLINKKIYKYCLENKPKNKGSWKCSQIYDLKIPKSLRGQYTTLRSSICQEKLFLIVNDHKTLIIQIDLSNMTFERQYISEGFILDVFLCNSDGASFYRKPIIMNKNQTLFAIADDYTYIFSMENGMLILKYNYGEENSPVEFITLEDNSERLVINQHFSLEHKLLDPYQPYYEIDISQDFNKKSVITKSNKKICIDKNGNVCIKNGLELKQLTNKNIYRNSIYYTLFTFKVIQNMLDDIIKQVEIKKVASSKEFVLKHNFKINNEGLCQLYLRNNFNSVTDNVIPNIDYYNDEITLRKSTGKEIKYIKVPHILSYELLNDQNLVLINMRGIDIYSINEFGLKHQYFWHNDEWDRIYKKFIKDHGNKFNASFIDKYYKPLFINVYNSEFNDSKYLIPLSRLNCNDAKEIIEDFINDTVALSRFGLEMLKMAISDKIDYQLIKQLATGIIDNEMAISKFGTEILNIAFKENYHDVVYQTIDKIIKSTQDYSETYMTFISLFLKNLCEYYPDSIVKYILSTSIILSPYCNKIKNSKNTSLYSYSKNIYVKESNMDNNYFKIILSFLKELWIREETQTVSFIVPFPRICEYNDNPWNKFIYEPKSILFCNIDGDHLYNWWNFAAIVDYKWKTFGWIYYYLNCYYDVPVTKVRKLINAINNDKAVFDYPPFISKKLEELVVLTNDNKKQNNEEHDDEGNKNNKLVEQKEPTKEELIQQNNLLKKQITDINDLVTEVRKLINAIDNNKKQSNEKHDNKEKQYNKPEKQIEQTNEDLTQQNNEKLTQQNNVPNQQTDDFDPFSTDEFNPFNLIKKIEGKQSLPPTIIDSVKKLAVEEQNKRLSEKQIEQTNEDLIQQNNKDLTQQNNVPNQQTDDFDPFSTDEFNPFNLIKKIEGQQSLPPTIIDSLKKLAVEEQNKRLSEKQIEQTNKDLTQQNNEDLIQQNNEDLIQQNNEDLTQQNNVPNQQTDDFDPFSTDEFNPFNLTKKIESEQSLSPTIIDSVKKLAIEEQNKRLKEKK